MTTKLYERRTLDTRGHKARPTIKRRINRRERRAARAMLRLLYPDFSGVNRSPQTEE